MIEALEAAILSKDNHQIRQSIAALCKQTNSIHALVPLINLALKNKCFDLSLQCFEKAVIHGLAEHHTLRFIQEPFFNDNEQLAKDFLTIANRHCKQSMKLKLALIKKTINTNNYDDAILLLNDFLSSNPNSEVLSLLSECYFKKFDLHSAKAAILLACELSPNNTQHLLTLATIEKLLCHFPASAGLLGKIIEMDVGNHQAHSHLAYLALFSGEFELGWNEYEWHRRYSPDWNPPLPQWQGEQSEHYHLLIWSNDNLSEQILFLSLINRLVPKVTLKVTPQLINLLPVNEPTVAFLPTNYRGDYSEFDGHLPLSCLAKHFIKQPSDIFKLSNQPFPVMSKRSSLSKNDAKIGFSWIGDTTHDGVPQTLKLEYWQHLLCFPHCEFIAFENNICLSDQQILDSINVSSVKPMDTGDLTQLITDLLELDYLLTVDNYVAHLAGALGIRTLVFLPEVSNWYWFSGEGPSPWYPTLELSRSLPVMNHVKSTPSTNKAIQEWQKDSQLLVNNRLKEIVNVNCGSIATRTAS